MDTTIMRLRRRIMAAQEDRDSGFAMVVVLGMATVMTLLVSSGLLYATNTSTRASATDTNKALAYQAALAGVADFQARMNEAARLGQLPYCSSIDANNKAESGWQYVNGTSGPAYHYRWTSDCSVGTGDSSDVKLKVTGIAGPRTGPSDPETRTIVAEIKRPGFRDYVFFTDKEEGDPGLPEYGLTTSQQAGCAVYSYSSTTLDTRPTYCIDLGFGTGDVLNGKVHTNDAIRINGNATFNAGVTEGCPGLVSGTPCYTSKYINDGGTPAFNGGVPQTNTVLQFPTTDGSVQASAAAGGCVYQGPTRIVLLASGNMSIASPKSTATTACPLGTNVPMPANGVIFVKNVLPTDPNYSTTCTTPYVTNPTTGAANSGGTSFPLANDYDVTKNYINCNEGNIWIEGVLKGLADIGAESEMYITGDITYANGLTGANATDGLGLVAQDSIAFYHPIGDTTTVTTPANCTRYAAKNASSPVTTAETTSAHCTGTLRSFTGAAATTDSTAANCTTRNTSVSSSSYCNYGTWNAAITNTTTGELCASPCMRNLTVDAALLSISHSIRLPYFNQSYTSDLGTLTINGSLAEYYRGPVRQGNPGAYHGYTKTYNYDPRLVNLVLPGFPQITSVYGANSFTNALPDSPYNAPCYGTWKIQTGCPGS